MLLAETLPGSDDRLFNHRRHGQLGEVGAHRLPGETDRSGVVGPDLVQGVKQGVRVATCHELAKCLRRHTESGWYRKAGASQLTQVGPFAADQRQGVPIDVRKWQDQGRATNHL